MKCISILRITKSTLMYSAVMVLLGGSVVTGCFAPEESLTVGDRTLVDSLYHQQRQVLDSLMADSCTAFRTTHLPYWMDSIMQARQREILELIDRYEE